MDATQHAMAAKGHSEDAARQIHQIVSMLKETLSYLIGTNDDAIALAATHLHEIYLTVGSSTAGSLSDQYHQLAQSVKQAPTEGITRAIEHLEPIAEYLVRLGNDTEALASILGA